MESLIKFQIGDYVSSRKIGNTFNHRGVIGRIDAIGRQEKYLVRFEVGEECWLLPQHLWLIRKGGSGQDTDPSEDESSGSDSDSSEESSNRSDSEMHGHQRN